MFLPQFVLLFTALVCFCALAVEEFNITTVQSQMCFLTAISSNHYPNALKFISSTQKIYPCSKVYIYDLGLKAKQSRFLDSLPYVHGVLTLNTTKAYFPNQACRFKPLMFLEFINMYQKSHQCRFFFYGDASVYIYKRFDDRAIDEVLRLGLVAQLPKVKLTQLEYTAPKMFEYFNVDRVALFRQQRSGGSSMHQVQAGLLLVDAGNATMRDGFFRRWAACANDDECLIPDNILIKKGFALSLLKNFSIEGHRVFRAHRDDQSAFTFLISEHFGYGKSSERQVFLDSYTWVRYNQVSYPSRLLSQAANCSSSNSSSIAAGKNEPARGVAPPQPPFRLT